MDIRVEDHGTIATFTPVSDAGQDFLVNEVESEGWQWFGRALCVDHRMAGILATAAVAHGLAVGG